MDNELTGELIEIKLLPSPEELAESLGRDYVPDANGFVEQITSGLIDELAKTYKPGEVHEAPIIIGHDSDPQFGVPNSDKLPAMGWMRKLFVRNGALYGLAELTQLAKEWIKNKYYRYSSIGYYKADSPNCPTPGQAYIRHLALLGAQPPAIKGLGPLEIQFGEANIMTVLQPEQLNTLVALAEQSEDEQEPTTDATAVAPEAAEDQAPATEAVETQQDEQIEMAEPTEGEAPAEAPAEGEGEAPTDANAFLAENAGDILRYLLSEGEDGYKGEISSFNPEPSADNGWLWNEDEQQFAGQFSDESLGEPQTFDFTLAKQGDSWERTYKPAGAGDEEADLEQPEAPAEEAPAPANETPAEAGQGEAISQMSEGAPDEAAMLRAQLAAANAKLAEIKNAELSQFAEQLYAEGKLVEGQFAKADLVALLQFAEQAGASAVITFSEGQVAPASKLKALLSTLPAQVHFGETKMGECGKDKKEKMPPAGAVFDSEGTALDAEVKQYCEKNGLDPNKPADYKKALRAVSS